MTTTVKRITVSLTKEQERQLKALCDYLGENKGQVLTRAIECFFNWHYLDRVTTEAAPDNPSQFP